METEDGQVDTVETEVNFRLPRGSDPGLELVPKDMPMVPDTPDPGQQRRLGPLSGAKPELFSTRSRPPPRAGTQPVTDRFMETPTTSTPGHSSPPPKAGTQLVTYRLLYKIPTLPTPGHRSRR